MWDPQEEVFPVVFSVSGGGLLKVVGFVFGAGVGLLLRELNPGCLLWTAS